MQKGTLLHTAVLSENTANLAALLEAIGDNAAEYIPSFDNVSEGLVRIWYLCNKKMESQDLAKPES